MYKSNDRLQHDVLDEFRWDVKVDAASIGVAVSNGVVSLFGEVTSEGGRRAAVAAAERVPGVRAVAESLLVKTPGGLRRSDTDLAREVADVLSRHAEVPESVKARVEDGWVWLEGEVDWPYQRAIADRVIQDCRARLYGLRGVTNEIVVARPATLPAILSFGRTVSS